MNSKKKSQAHEQIIVENARTHNLRGVFCKIPHLSVCCVTGVSGSGKSSFAFDTLYVEGQRRYLQSVSSQAKRIIGAIPRPDFDAIHGLTPTIAVAQKTSSGNLRSTVGTMTEIYDYLRILFAHLATPHCPISKQPLTPRTKAQIVDAVLAQYEGKHIYILAPYVKQKKGSLKEEISQIERKGYVNVRIDGQIQRTTEALLASTAHNLDILIDSVILKQQSQHRVKESILTALQLGKGSVEIVDKQTQKSSLFSEFAYSQANDTYYPPLEPLHFSFNSPEGMCEHCQGLGQQYDFIINRIIDESKSIREDCCSIAGSYESTLNRNLYDNLASLYNFSVDKPWKSLPEEARHVLLYGTEKKWTRMTFIDSRTGAVHYEHVQWRGFIPEAKIRYHQAKSAQYKRKMEALMEQTICQQCHGSRLQPYPASARLFDHTIFDLASMPISELLAFLSKISLSKEQQFAEETFKNIISRLSFLEHVGLGYLTLTRATPTLSGGESQRVQLAAHIGGGLSGITYILDEPSIGLHPHDNEKLIESLHSLKDKGNTVIVVEHDPQTILAADWILDFGPGAGELGGTCLYEGSLQDFLPSQKSLTAAYLSGKKCVQRQHAKRELATPVLCLRGATLHNLKNVSVSIPLRKFVAVTGVSGSGKSSLILETLYPALSKLLMGSQRQGGPFDVIEGVEHLQSVMHIDQTPIGRTPRSNPATYSGVFNLIRELFASLPESKARGWTSGRFSFNVREGTCPVCSGMGVVPINMDFLDEVWTPCEECHGKRFDEETLSVKFKEKNIHDVLEMTCHEAHEHFSSIPTIRHHLDILCRVGLDYLKLGQPATTLSGGEAQRLKIAKELARPSTGNTLYLLDEPTTGLHSHDLEKLLHVLHELVDRGNSVLVIEHNMELIKTADWIIDMGPGSGNAGGQIIIEGTPEAVAVSQTPTGKALATIPIPRASNGTQGRASTTIEVTGAKQNNLQQISVHIPKNAITALIGPSGSGKNSLAFETLFAEGERRYIESLSSYARQFVKQMPKAHVDTIQNLAPAVGIEQRRYASNPKSTLGTISEIYDYLRIYWAKVGIPHCPKTGAVIRSITKERVVDLILSWPANTPIIILSSYDIVGTSALNAQIQKLRASGYIRFRIQDHLYNTDIDTLPAFQPGTKIKFEVVIDRIKIGPDKKARLLESIGEAAKLGNGCFIVLQENDERFFNLAFSVEETGESFPSITAQTLSFAHPQGMCPECRGAGSLLHLDLVSLVNPSTTIRQFLYGWLNDELAKNSSLSIDAFFSNFGIDPNKPLSQLSSKEKQLLLHGSSTLITQKDPSCSYEWIGLQTVFDTLLNHPSKDIEEMSSCLEDFSQSQKPTTCPACHGSRLNPLARNITIEGISIAQFCAMPISQASQWFSSVVAQRNDYELRFIISEIQQRFQTANTLGIGYLSLDRTASTLSSGEAQRSRLISQIGSHLSGILYVIDEPTAGLHPEDQKSLFHVLNEVKSRENTILMIEHDPHAIKKADHIIELGPGSGQHGGTLIFEGDAQKFWKSSTTHASFYEPSKPSSTSTRKPTSFINIKNATCHNLINFSCSIPTQAIVGVIGVSGSGKSTLVFDIIASEALNNETQFVSGLDSFRNCVMIDQKPLGQVVKSDVSSFMDLASSLRKVYADLPASKERGLDGTHFSTRLSRGMCRRCGGLGYRKIDMYFLSPVKIVCDECHGLRLNPISLSVEYQGKNFGQILQCTVEEAKELFRDEEKIVKALDSLIEMGLNYLLLGQEIGTLSSGEIQRMRIAKEAAKGRRHKTLYLLDEPTTGLHPQETQALIRRLHALRDEGHSIIVVEHNIDLISACDYLIELGPHAGPDGGKIIAQGSCEEILKNSASITAKYL
jgi:excinuclease ABC subunit A